VLSTQRRLQIANLNDAVELLLSELSDEGMKALLEMERTELPGYLDVFMDYLQDRLELEEAGLRAFCGTDDLHAAAAVLAEAAWHKARVLRLH
jgi:hypothetical protein